jgi:transcriptional regulator with XRE-family HTH domain
MPDAASESFATFGSLLKHLRRRARLTQKELDIAVGYSEAHVARLENGQRLPDLTTVRSLLVQALGLESESALANQLVELAKTARDGVVPQTKKAGPTPTIGGNPYKTIGPYRTISLPVQLTRFIGREQEIAAVKSLLNETRLLTLTGSAGAGKTRLALQVAGELPNAYADGIWLVELAPVNDPALVADTVALGISPSNRSALEVLIGNLRDREMLLILDNCEHLVDACAQLAEALLRACPELHLLATRHCVCSSTGVTTCSSCRSVTYWNACLFSPAVGHWKRRRPCALTRLALPVRRKPTSRAACLPPISCLC